MDELTKEFLAESLEGLDRMERCLTELESHPDDAALLGEIFRSVHTIKGTTGFLGFKRLETLAHRGENLLGALREGRLIANEEIISGLLQLLDGLRGILQLIETTGGEGERKTDDDHVLIALLNGLAEGGPQKPVAPMVKAAEPVDAQVTAQAAAAADKTLRIDVEVLNRMMNLVGELVLTRNQILQTTLSADNFPKLARRLDAVTADLRETVMQARMQPVGQLFGKFPRMVRDLARTCGKQVRIEFYGQDTGLDKSLLEAIKDPLTHAVRNAVDHGVETPGDRLLARKPAEGVIKLKAYHQSGSVVVELIDDGAGIRIPRVLEKALERGLITEQQVASMTEREVLQLVFLPGFSTAATVTSVSGRGVGMDVVKLNIEKVGGSVELESRAGVGTTLRMRVPLTLAIVPALIVQSGGQSFCLPQGALAELVYIPRREAAQAFERIGDAELYRLRDRLLPMVWLDRLLTLDGHEERMQQETHGFYLAVLESEGCRFGLIVDDLLAPEEIVVKPLSAVLREIGLFSGATVLGNGTLALILDVAATAERAGVRAEVEEPVATASVAVAELGSRSGSFLIFEGAGEGASSGFRRERMALPLEAVERIESVPVGQVEFAGGKALLQYRGELLPLEDMDGTLLDLAAKGSATLATVLICRRPGPLGAQAGQRVGMVVRRVLDVSNGTLMEEDVEVCDQRLAMVKEKLTVVHQGFLGPLQSQPAQRQHWGAVA